MKKLLLLGVLVFALCPSSWATSKLPPEIRVMVTDEKVVFSFRSLLDETNDGEITKIAVCRQSGSQCLEDLWVVQFPAGWRGQEVTLFQDYPEAAVLKRSPSARYADGSYALYVDFHERGWRKKQTVSNTVTEFCLVQGVGGFQLQSPDACAARRVREDQMRRSDDVRASLKKWGMAYCLRKFQQQGPDDEAGWAKGGYFQLGDHREVAYQHVQAYFDRVAGSDTRIMQATGKPNDLMRCLDAYERPEYSQLIKAQDRWIY